MDQQSHNLARGILQLYNMFKIATVILTLLSIVTFRINILSLILIILSFITFYISIQLYINFNEIYDEDMNYLDSIVSRRKQKNY